MYFGSVNRELMKTGRPAVASSLATTPAARGLAGTGGSMVSKPSVRSGSPRPRANVPLANIPAALRKLKRRLDDVEGMPDPIGVTDVYTDANIIANKVNATIDEVFGADTADAADFHINEHWFTPNWGPTEWHEKLDVFVRGRSRAAAVIRAAIDRLNERLADADEDRTDGVLRAYEGLDLHSEIARAASKLYRDGHYSTAVEHAVKALNDLVRLRSKLSFDGMTLMERAFSPGNPTLKFNALASDSDRDEQKGFMMMFRGAVAGLRNPRAHGFIHDDPERALEFIAFVSLLAKLLDETK